MTYLAYANTRRGFATPYSEAAVGRVISLTPGEIYLHDHPELGGSLYDVHRDGTGRHFSSYRRPMLNIRPKVTSWLGATGSAVWALNADLHIVDWLAALNIQVDVVTDHDLDREGEALLRAYNLVLTGTHPEYTSRKMFDALESHVQAGGSIFYLGENGFYHRVEFDPEGSGIVEVRRQGGSWKAPLPEQRFQASGRLGGGWADLMRPVEDLFGVLCVAEGFERSSYYRRHPVSWTPPFDKLFKGADEEIVGDFGLIGGAAAGLEVDRVVSGTTLDARVTVLASKDMGRASRC